MTLGRHDYHSDLQSLHDDCQRHLNYHVTLTMADGTTFDGIIEHVDMDRITVLVGEDVMERESESENANTSDERQYYGFGYGPPRRPRRRFRRFRRRQFPLASLAALALLPYIVPPAPYPYPYYPYY